MNTLDETRTSRLPPAGPDRIRPALALVLAALAQAVGAETVNWTGNAPLLFAVDGGNVFEFQFPLDLAGYCNAHPSATCTSTTYWNSNGNWTRPGAIGQPTLLDTAVIGAGATVSIAQLNSLFQGGLSGYARAGAIDASSATIEVRSSGGLESPSASVYRLRGNGRFINNGTANINWLDGLTLAGSGVTRVTEGFEPTTLLKPGSYISGGHTLKFEGTQNGEFGFLLEPQALLVNKGTFATGLQAGLANGAKFMMQGTASAATLPRVVNEGDFTGSFSLEAVTFDNAASGRVSLGVGEGVAIDRGVHAGRFLGTAGSSFTFGGSVIGNNSFLAGSAIDSNGSVLFARGVHKVAGSYDVPTLTVGSGSSTEFSGSVSPLDSVQVQGESGFLSGGRLKFTATVNPLATTAIGELVVGDLAEADLGPGGDLAIGSLRGTRATLKFAGAGKATIDTALVDRSSVTFETGQQSSIGRLELRNGGLFANSALDIAEEFLWAGGPVGGTGKVVVKKKLDIAPGTLSPTSLSGGTLEYQGTTGRWRASIGGWGGKLVNASGATLTLEGAFDATESAFSPPADAGFYNHGSFRKSAGATATLGVQVFNSGLIDVDAGTLVLGGGGELRQGSFLDAASGTAIELRAPSGRGWLVDENLRTRSSGRVEFLGGDVRFTARGRETVTSGETFGVDRLRLDAGAQLLADQGAQFDAGSIDNAGLLELDTSATTGGYVSSASGALFVGTHGNVTAGGTNFDAAGHIHNLGNLDIRAESAQLRGVLTNDGALSLGALLSAPSPAPGFTQSTVTGRIDSLQGASFSTQGVVRMQGAGTRYAGASGSQWSNFGILMFEQGARAEIGAGSVLQSFGSPGAFAGNALGPVFDDGGLFIDSGASVEGNGSFLLDGGYARIWGRLATAGGVEIRNGKLRGRGVIDLMGSGIPVLVGPGGSINPGNSPGKLTILGDVEVLGSPMSGFGGALEFDVYANGDYNWLEVSGTARLAAGSTLRVNFESGAHLVEGAGYRLLRTGGGIVDEGSVVEFEGAPSGFSAQYLASRGTLVVENLLAVELLGLIQEDDGGRFANIAADQVVRHTSDEATASWPDFIPFPPPPGTPDTRARLDRLTNAGQFHNRAGALMMAFSDEGAPDNPHGILRIENLAGGSFINRGNIRQWTSTFYTGYSLVGDDISILGSGWHGNTVENDGYFENGAGAALAVGLITNRGEFVNAGRIDRGQYGFGPPSYEPRANVVNESGGHFVNQLGGVVEAFKVINDGDFEQAGRLELAYGVSQGTMASDVASFGLINRGHFRVTGKVEVVPADMHPGVYQPKLSILNLPGPGGDGAQPAVARFDIAAGGSVTGAERFEQGGWLDTALHVDGLLETEGSIYIGGGSLSGAGTLRAPNVDIRSTALSPGNSPGTLTIDGDLMLAASSIFIEVESPTVYDRLLVTGRATLAGNYLTIRLAEDVQPTVGFGLTWLDAAGGIVANGNPFAYWEITRGLGEGYALFADSSGYRDALLVDAGLVINMGVGGFGVSAVPLPPSALLLAGGLLPLVLRARRRVG